jgi:hypothetical protein
MAFLADDEPRRLLRLTAGAFARDLRRGYGVPSGAHSGLAGLRRITIDRPG